MLSSHSREFTSKVLYSYCTIHYRLPSLSKSSVVSVSFVWYTRLAPEHQSCIATLFRSYCVYVSCIIPRPYSVVARHCETGLPWLQAPPTPPAHLLSSVYYMEHFHWSLSDADKLSFSLVTLRAAVEYIRGPEVEKLLTRAETTQQKVSVIHEPSCQVLLSYDCPWGKAYLRGRLIMHLFW